MDEPPLETTMEVREEFMVSPAGDSKPILRTAHFLEPIPNSIDDSLSEALSSSVSSVPTNFEPKEWPLKFHFNAWRSPPKKWVSWLDTLYPKYESVWKKAGIFEAIMATKCQILRTEELVLGVAEKWCSKTNTFVFPWGEVTITLEDVMVLGGYPVLGEPVFTTLEGNKEMKEMKEAEEKLILARKEAWKSTYRNAKISSWINLFINREWEIEHEAFLATWLSLFVLNHGHSVKSSVFPMAIHLARGKPVALAPAVLASIYRDLSFLKRRIVELTKNPEVEDGVEFVVNLRSPFHLVQIWVWERFKNLQPVPNKLIKNEDPVLAKWDKVKALKIDNVRVALNSGVDDFLWRPYARCACKLKLFYPENEMCVPFESDTDLYKELVSYVTCLRVSELVGFGSVSLVKQYLPHRVAMQFGMDQDVPACVPRFNDTQAIAWDNYCRPISDEVLYFPSRLFEADVTQQYIEWWKRSVLVHKDPVKNIVQRERSARSIKKSLNDADVQPGFPPKNVSNKFRGKSREYGLKSRNCGNGDHDADVPHGFLAKRVKTCGNLVQDGLKAGENCDAGVPIYCSPKHENLSTADSFEDSIPTALAENKAGSATCSPGKATTGEVEHLSSSLASTDEYGPTRKTKLLVELTQTKLVVEGNSEPYSVEALEEDFENASGSKEQEQRVSSDKVVLPNVGSDAEGYGCSSDMDIVVDLEERIGRLERLITKAKIARGPSEHMSPVTLEEDQHTAGPREWKVYTRRNRK